jgi:hypothetical protein
MKTLILTLIFSAAAWAQSTQPGYGGPVPCSATVTKNCTPKTDANGNLTIGRAETAGSGGVTANYLAAKDTSNPTKYVLPVAAGCGSGIAAASAISGATFFLYASAGQAVSAVADGTITAGHLLTGGSSTPGRVADTGQSARASVPSSTCIVGVAKASATVGQAVSIVYDGPGSFGSGSFSDDGTTITAAAGRNLAISASLLTNAEYDNGTCTTAKTIDPTKGNQQKITLTDAQTCVLTFTQPAVANAVQPTMRLQLKVIQSSAGAFSGAVSGGKWPGGVVPTITRTSGAVDFVSCYLDGANAYCMVAQDFR